MLPEFRRSWDKLHPEASVRVVGCASRELGGAAADLLYCWRAQQVRCARWAVLCMPLCMHAPAPLPVAR